MQTRGLFSLVLFFLFSGLFFNPATGQESSEGIIFWSVTAPKGFKPDLLWVAYDPEFQKMVSKKGKDKKVQTLDGETITKAKGKDFETRYYYLRLPPGTYVLHSIASGGSLTSFFPTTPGFTIRRGESLFLGHFEAQQLKNTYRGLVDPRTGLSLLLVHNDPTRFDPMAKDLEGEGMSGQAARMVPGTLRYFAVEDYTRETSDAQ